MDILHPAICLADEGYSVAPVAAHGWRNGSVDLLAASNTHGRDLLLGGERAPLAGEVMRMPLLADTFRVSTAAAVPMMINSTTVTSRAW